LHVESEAAQPIRGEYTPSKGKKYQSASLASLYVAKFIEEIFNLAVYLVRKKYVVEVLVKILVNKNF
jgi:hypothetical protein